MTKKIIKNETLAPNETTRLESRLFNAIDIQNKKYITKKDFIHFINKSGIRIEDPRLQSVAKQLSNLDEVDKIDFKLFVDIIKNNQTLIEKILTGNLIIPNFEEFSQEIKSIYSLVIKNKSGKTASYIPQLAQVNPEQFGVALCTTDGQIYSIGDANTYFCLQSVCKPINYCLIQQEHGEEKVHRHIGKEPSGHGFNVLTLNNKNLPHNPLINAGAIAACAFIKPHSHNVERYNYVMRIWEELCGSMTKPHFNNSVFLSEKETADRNFALAHFMREYKVFPEGTDLNEVLDLYFQCCSLEMTTESMSVVAATLANSGICPLSENRIFDANTVKNCLSLMYSCGMYDFSGEFAFTVGLPAKSGVSGVLMVVVPQVMGICIWSPRIDKLGNSVRGIEFCKELVKNYNFHNYDSMIQHSEKKDPRRKTNDSKFSNVMALIWAASLGDLTEVTRLTATGVNLNEADYDGRTALHLAASEGHTDIIRYLLDKKVDINPIDRWGNTPLVDAYSHHHQEAAKLLEKSGGKKAK